MGVRDKTGCCGDCNVEVSCPQHQSARGHRLNTVKCLLVSLSRPSLLSEGVPFDLTVLLEEFQQGCPNTCNVIKKSEARPCPPTFSPGSLGVRRESIEADWDQNLWRRTKRRLSSSHFPPPLTLQRESTCHHSLNTLRTLRVPLVLAVNQPAGS